MSDYRGSYVEKRGDLDSRKKNYHREGSNLDKHREYSSKPPRRSIEDRRDYSNERRDSTMKRPKEHYPPNHSKELYQKERMDSFSSRSRDSYPTRGGRDSFPMRGRGSLSSRGGFGGNRGSRGSFGAPRGGNRDSFSSRGSFRERDSYSNRGSFGFSRGNNRDSFSSRGSYGSPRGGRDSYSSRGRDSYSSRGRDSYQGRGMRGSGRGFRGAKRGMKSDSFMPHFSSRTQYEMKKLVESVLEDVDDHGHYDRPYRMKEFKRDTRDYNPRESDRSYKETSRSFDHHQSFTHGEKMLKRERSSSSAHYDKEKEYYSEKSKMKLRNKYEGASSKRMHEDDNTNDHHDDGPPHKQQRLQRRERYRESESQDDFEYNRRNRSYSPAATAPAPHRDERPRKVSKEKERDAISSKTRERSRKRDDREAKVESEDEKRRRKSKSEEEKDDDEEEEEEEKEKMKVKRKFSSPREDEEEEDEEMEEDVDDDEYEDRRRRDKNSPSGMQVTIRSDGERAVNSEGRVKSRISSGKIFVELQCPHCPGQRSITFKEYRYHLDSRSHRNKIEKLTFKHSVGLRRIRLQQRNEQRDIEEKWEKDKPEEFKDTISTYCNLCKLAYKCLPEDNSAKGIKEHNESKLHKVQQRYLFPRCVMCRMSFPSRLVYEYHIASIRHLRMSTMCRENGLERSVEDDFKEEGVSNDKEEIDLTNFITMDSVGEDEEIGSEQEEITGKLEDIEKAEEDAKEGEGEEEEEGGEEMLAEEEENFELDVVDEDRGDFQEEEEEEERAVCGKDFVVPVEAVYCKLCHKALRLDTPLGKSIIDRHCSSELHVENYHYLDTDDFMGGGGGGEEEQEESFNDDGPGPEDENLAEVEDQERPDEEPEDEPEDTAQEGKVEEEEVDSETGGEMEEQGDDIDLDNHDEDIISIKDSKSNRK